MGDLEKEQGFPSISMFCDRCAPPPPPMPRYESAANQSPACLVMAMHAHEHACIWPCACTRACMVMAMHATRWCRSQPKVQKCQNGFITFIVKPMFAAWCEYVPSLHGMIMPLLEGNLSIWGADACKVRAWEGEDVREEGGGGGAWPCVGYGLHAACM